MLTLGMQQQQQ